MASAVAEYLRGAPAARLLVQVGSAKMVVEETNTEGYCVSIARPHGERAACFDIFLDRYFTPEPRVSFWFASKDLESVRRVARACAGLYRAPVLISDRDRLIRGDALELRDPPGERGLGRAVLDVYEQKAPTWQFYGAFLPDRVDVRAEPTRDLVRRLAESILEVARIASGW